jgi:hypothetical protein
MDEHDRKADRVGGNHHGHPHRVLAYMAMAMHDATIVA